MEKLTPNANKIAFKWAVIYVITAIVITYIIEIAKLDPNSPVKYLGYIPLIAFLLLAQKEYKDQLGGYVDFGSAFSAGFRYSLFAGLMFAVFLYLYLTVLSPEVFAKTIDSQRDAMAAKGLSSEQVDKGIDIAKKYGAAIGAIVVVIFYLIIGAVFGLIGAAIFKRERTGFDPEPEATEPTV
ncbi:MAG: hypothetical protein JWQ66_1711 [Mucilaginibacter sp.]|nr:hypothetical protein [Mucilaginibacter sp.]